MRNFLESSFIKGIFVGGAISAAALLGFAYGQAHLPEDAEAGERAALTSCQVRVGYGRLSAGYQCNFNQVMVGHLNGNLYCADIQVTCP